MSGAFAWNGTIIRTNSRTKYSIHNEIWPFETSVYLNTVSSSVLYIATHEHKYMLILTCSNGTWNKAAME